jgi:hypothetical protein
MKSISRRKAIMFRLGLLGVGALFAVAMLAGVELVFKLLNDREESRITSLGDDPIEFCAPLAYRPRANATARAAKVVDGTTVYDVRYTFDEWHRRVTPPCEQARRFLFVFGCSVAFGEGVEDADTLPAQLAQRLPETQVYNYGYSGYGPQQAVALLEDDALATSVTPETGTAIYIFLPGHVRRAIGSMRMWVEWGRHFPCYRRDDGGVTLEGSFVNVRPWRSRMYDVLGRSQTLRYAQVDWPLRVRDDDCDLAAGILGAARNAFEARYSDGTFLVVLFPDLPNNEFPPARIIPFLEQRGVPYLDLSNAVDMSSSGMTIPGDGHPTALGYAAVADALAPKL